MLFNYCDIRHAIQCPPHKYTQLNYRVHFWFEFESQICELPEVGLFSLSFVADFVNYARSKDFTRHSYFLQAWDGNFVTLGFKLGVNASVLESVLVVGVRQRVLQNIYGPNWEHHYINIGFCHKVCNMQYWYINWVKYLNIEFYSYTLQWEYIFTVEFSCTVRLIIAFSIYMYACS